MDAALVSAAFGLGGVTVGGLTTFLTGWTTQRLQLRHEHRESLILSRETLFRAFVVEASRLYGDALSHEKDDVADLVQLYALIADMRLTATQRTVARAEEVMERIIDTYLAPNRTLHDLRRSARAGERNFLLGFGESARSELSKVDP